MVDGLIARAIIGIFALFVLVLIAGVATTLGEARAHKDMAKVSRQSASFVALTLVEIVLIVVLAFS